MSEQPPVHPRPGPTPPEGLDDPILTSLPELYPSELIESIASDVDLQQRRRKLHPVLLAWHLVLAFASESHHLLAAVRKGYAAEPEVSDGLAHSSFYAWFKRPLVEFMRRLAQHGLQALAANSQRRLAPQLSAAFEDVLMIDSTTIALNPALRKRWPSTHPDRAACKVHMQYSLLTGGPSEVSLHPARAHDSSLLKTGGWVRGRLLLFDLGYFSYARFASIVNHGGAFVCRLKDGIDPLITAVNIAHRGRSMPLVGERLRSIEGRLKRRLVDLTVEVQRRKRTYGGSRSMGPLRIRCVGVLDARTKAYHWYLTSVDHEVLSAEAISDVYAVRWGIETAFRELKTDHQVRSLQTTNSDIVETVLWAAVASMVATRWTMIAARRELGDRARVVSARRWGKRMRENASTMLDRLLRLLGFEGGTEEIWRFELEVLGANRESSDLMEDKWLA